MIGNTTWFQSHIVMFFGMKTLPKCFSSGSGKRDWKLFEYLQNRVRPLKNNLAFMVSDEKSSCI